MHSARRQVLMFAVLALLAWEPALCWQQDVVYEIRATLRVETHTLEGTEVLVYRNNSPDTLDHLWIHLYPNAYRDRESKYAKEEELMGNYTFSFSGAEDRGYVEIASVSSEGRPLEYEVDGTKMRVESARPLKPGEELYLEIEFHLKIPKIFSRLGHKGRHYEMSQWYPKAVVYDAHGWHPDGYHALGEFYGEFGDYDVWITLPHDMVVGATGVLVEPEEEIKRMDSLAAGERLEREEGTKTLHFRAEKVHDFAWVADPDYRLIRGEHGRTRINILCLPKHEGAWKEVLGYARDALAYYGTWYGDYPYSTLTVADGYLGAGGGMEYPNLVIISVESPSLTRLLELVVMHEIGHQWFYGVLGSNEMDETWLDEGINSFSELRYMEEKYGREGNLFNWPKWLDFMPSFGDRWFHQVAYYIAATNHAEKPILTPAHEFVHELVAYQAAAYSKAAWVVDMLRYLLGDETFDEVMRTYVQRYSYKHPHTPDFIQVAEEVSGQELDWFFDQWLRTTEVCDYGIRRVERKGETTEVVVERKGGIVMPVDVLLETKDGDRHLKGWDGREKLKTLTFQTEKAIKYALVDPDNRILEVDKWNNRAPRRITVQPIFSFPSFDSYQIFYGPLVGINSVDGVRLGGFLHGREFFDHQFLKGRNNWELSFSSGLKTRRWFYNLSYRTPLYFSKNRVRLRAGSCEYLGESRHKLGLSIRLGNSILSGAEHRISLGVTLANLWLADYVDDRDYALGRTSSGSASYSYSYSKRNLSGCSQIRLMSAREALGGDWSFDKLSLESAQRLRLTKSLKLRVRAFLGSAFGETPPQEQFFLSGQLRPTGLSALFIGRKGTWSPQERWHIEGEGNMRGYFGRHIHDRVVASLNTELPLGRIPKTPLKPTFFYDLGNAWSDFDSLDSSLLSDFGVSLPLGPVDFSFPFWISHPKEDEKRFAFRWTIGLRGSFGPSISL